jgi:hypothetical protein
VAAGGVRAVVRRRIHAGIRQGHRPEGFSAASSRPVLARGPPGPARAKRRTGPSRPAALRARKLPGRKTLPAGDPRARGQLARRASGTQGGAQDLAYPRPVKEVVLAFVTALPRHGGAGALYVLLRKFKKTRGKVRWEDFWDSLE